MSSIEEDMRKALNKAPFANPFVETFDANTDSLEALRGAIDALEYGIFGYGIVSGPQEVEIADKADFEVELLNPGGEIVPAGSITPGVYFISRIRNGVKQQVHPDPGDPDVAAVAADGKVVLDTSYEFVSGTDAPPVYYWEPGDLFEVKFTGIKTTIDSTETFFPDMVLQGRVVRDEEITIKLGAFDVTNNLKALLGDLHPTTKQLGQILGGFGHTENLKDILGNLTTTKNLGGILGAFTAAQNLKVILGDLATTKPLGEILGNLHPTTKQLGQILGGLTHTNNLYDILGGYTAAQSLKGSLGALDSTDNLRALLGDLHPTTKQLGNILGGFGHTENLKDILGDLATTKPLGEILGDLHPTTKQLGQILGGLTHTNNLYDILGGYTAAQSLKGSLGALDSTDNLRALLGDLHPTTKQLGNILGGFGHTENLKDILGNLTTTKNLGGILGAFTTAQNLKAILGNLSATKRLGETIGLLSETNTLYNLLGGADAVSNPIASDTKCIQTAAVTPPTVNSLARFIASGGTVLGSVLFDSLSIIDALGHNGNAVLGTGLGANIGNFQGRGNDPSILDLLGFPDVANGSLYERLGLLTNTNNLFTILGGYTAATHDTLKEHVNSLVIDDLTLGGAWHDAKSIAGFTRTIGVVDGADTVNSVAVVANEDGSVFERLEHLKSILDDNITDGTHAITNAHGIAETRVKLFTAHRTGELAVELDLNTLVAAGEGGTVTVRLKHMIDNATVRTIDIAQFIVGVDEVHPTVKGWVDSANADGVEVTIQCSVAVPTVNRDVPYKILEAC